MPTPRARRRRSLAVAVVALCLAVTGCGPELGPIARVSSIWSPQLPETSDPSVVRLRGEYFVYGSDNHLRAPVTRTSDLDRTYTLSQKNAITTEAMPTKPAWAVNDRQLWAPTVGKFGSTWVMFFSADRAGGYVPGNPQCIGRATASSPLGPFQPEPTPVHCGINGTGGALDPQIFVTAGGTPYLLAAFGNTESPIYSMRLDGNGRISGPATSILARQHPWEYHFIENPAMIYDRSRNNYVLTYSAGKWWEGRYSTGVARCSTPLGPCTSDPAGPWMASSNGRSGPGGLSFFPSTSGEDMAIFSTHRAGQESTNGGRSATVMPFFMQPAVGMGDIPK